MSEVTSPQGTGDDQEQITRFLRRRVGESLRSVTFVDSDGYTLQYVRDDVDAQYSDALLQSIFRDLEAEAKRSAMEEQQYQLGQLGCTVRCFAEGLVLLFPRDDSRNLVMSMDAEAAPRLHSFVRDCRQELR
jgi:hypothetical protein